MGIKKKIRSLWVGSGKSKNATSTGPTHQYTRTTTTGGTPSWYDTRTKPKKYPYLEWQGDDVMIYLSADRKILLSKIVKRAQILVDLHDDDVTVHEIAEELARKSKEET